MKITSIEAFWNKFNQIVLIDPTNSGFLPFSLEITKIKESNNPNTIKWFDFLLSMMAGPLSCNAQLKLIDFFYNFDFTDIEHTVIGHSIKALRTEQKCSSLIKKVMLGTSYNDVQELELLDFQNERLCIYVLAVLCLSLDDILDVKIKIKILLQKIKPETILKKINSFKSNKEQTTFLDILYDQAFNIEAFAKGFFCLKDLVSENILISAFEGLNEDKKPEALLSFCSRNAIEKDLGSFLPILDKSSWVQAFFNNIFQQNKLEKFWLWCVDGFIKDGLDDKIVQLKKFLNIVSWFKNKGLETLEGLSQLTWLEGPQVLESLEDFDPTLNAPFDYKDVLCLYFLVRMGREEKIMGLSLEDQHISKFVANKITQNLFNYVVRLKQAFATNGKAVSQQLPMYDKHMKICFNYLKDNDGRLAQNYCNDFHAEKMKVENHEFFLAIDYFLILLIKEYPKVQERIYDSSKEALSLKIKSLDRKLKLPIPPSVTDAGVDPEKNVYLERLPSASFVRVSSLYEIKRELVSTIYAKTASRTPKVNNHLISSIIKMTDLSRDPLNQFEVDFQNMIVVSDVLSFSASFSFVKCFYSLEINMDDKAAFRGREKYLFNTRYFMTKPMKSLIEKSSVAEFEVLFKWLRETFVITNNMKLRLLSDLLSSNKIEKLKVLLKSNADLFEFSDMFLKELVDKLYKKEYTWLGVDNAFASFYQELLYIKELGVVAEETQLLKLFETLENQKKKILVFALFDETMKGTLGTLATGLAFFEQSLWVKNFLKNITNKNNIKEFLLWARQCLMKDAKSPVNFNEEQTLGMFNDLVSLTETDESDSHLSLIKKMMEAHETLMIDNPLSEAAILFFLLETLKKQPENCPVRVFFENHGGIRISDITSHDDPLKLFNSEDYEITPRFGCLPKLETLNNIEHLSVNQLLVLFKFFLNTFKKHSQWILKNIENIHIKQLSEMVDSKKKQVDELKKSSVSKPTKPITWLKDKKDKAVVKEPEPKEQNKEKRFEYS